MGYPVSHIPQTGKRTKMKLISRIIWLSILLAITACQAAPTPTPSATPVPAKPAAPVLSTTKWQLVSYGNIDKTTAIIANTVTTLEFLDNGQFQVDSCIKVKSANNQPLPLACNTTSGKFIQNDSAIKVSEVSTKTVLCASLRHERQEDAYQNGLKNAERFAIKENQLIIYYANSTMELAFTKIQ